MSNFYFDLTRELNAHGRIAILASGQAVVFYRVAIMSKDGDWILRETEEACGRVLFVLGRHGARYRPGAPLDPRWLAGGWSSHFELFDSQKRRIRCDFVSRPPRLDPAELNGLFSGAPSDETLPVLPIEPLIRIKQTQRAKDYAVIGELARLLPAEKEVELTTDADRLLELVPGVGAGSHRPAIRAALSGLERDAVVIALAREVDLMQQKDRRRLERYETAAQDFLRELSRSRDHGAPLNEAHHATVALAERWLPLGVT